MTSAAARPREPRTGSHRFGVAGRALGIYATASFAGLQLLDISADRLGLSDRYFLATLIVLGLGFPLVAGWGLIRAVADEDQAPGATHARPATGSGGRPPAGLRPGARVRRGRRRLRLLAGLLLVLLAIPLFGWIDSRLLASARADGNERRPRSLVVLDFTSPTGDSVLAAAVSNAIRIDFEREPEVLALRRSELWNPLANGGPEDDPGAEIARALARAAGVELVISGELHRFGGAFIVSARLRDAEGRALLVERASSRDSADLLEAIETLSLHLQRVAGADVPGSRSSPGAATGSAGALRAYADGIRALRLDADSTLARLRLEEAVAHDPAFALAQLQLATLLHCLAADPARVEQAILAAYRERGRLTEQEWHEVVAAHALLVLREPARARLAHELLSRRNPEGGTAPRTARQVEGPGYGGRLPTCW